MSVILPGSYDPVTVGHLEIIKKAAALYDEVYVVIFVNPKKQYRFSVEDRARMLMIATEGLDNVLVSHSGGLVIDYMRDHGIEKIVKGYRTEADLPWEHHQAEWNKKMGGYDTELWKCDVEYESVSSTAVREALDRGEDICDIVPAAVAEYIQRIEQNG